MKWTRGRYIVLAVLALYALGFVVLSVDVLIRVWEWRGKFESRLDVLALLYFEGVRCIATLAGSALALWAAGRLRTHRALSALPLVILLATIAYTKLVAFNSFPGALQERLAVAIRGGPIPMPVIEMIFARPQWTAWLALAGVLLLLAHYPRTLAAREVEESGAADRRGALREVALAGADIGQLSRAGAARLIEGGWLAAPRVWLLGLLIAATHLGAGFLLDGQAELLAHAIALAAAAAGAAVAVALYRAAWTAADADERPVLLWLRRSVTAGGILFALSALTAVMFRGGAVSVAALSLAPISVLVGVTIAILRAPTVAPA